MLDHVGIQCADVEAAARFYDTVLAPLGFRRLMEIEHAHVIGYGADAPMFWIGPNTGAENRELHLAFVAADRDAVHAFFDAAVSTGAEVLHTPAEHPEYHPGYYAAFVRDPDGNNVEAVNHG